MDNDKIKQPHFAGRFYPVNADLLSKELRGFFINNLPGTSNGEPLALIVPHAGYVYSGKVAAAAYATLSPDTEYSTVFLIGSSHRATFNGASIHLGPQWSTPLGIVEVNVTLAERLVMGHPAICIPDNVFDQEHTLEVQLPFLQFYLKRPFRILPILIGTEGQGICEVLARHLAPYFGPPNLFVVSTDFSHFPAYPDALRVDQETAGAIMTNNPITLLNTLNNTGQKRVPGLSTSLCGLNAVLTLLHITHAMSDIHYTHLAYQNSGDNLNYGDHKRVVGYHAMAVYRNSQDRLPNEGGLPFELDEATRRLLLLLVRHSLKNHINGISEQVYNQEGIPQLFKSKTGLFVTLYCKDKLRGCIGNFHPKGGILETAISMAFQAAKYDNRFEHLAVSEMKDLIIEISLIGPMTRVASPGDFVPGRHGIYIKADEGAGTFLPQVATKMGWDAPQLLGHCSRDKAQIGWDGWKTAKVYKFETVVISEKEFE